MTQATIIHQAMLDIKRCNTQNSLDNWCRKNIQLYCDHDVIQDMVYRRRYAIIDQPGGEFFNPPDLKREEGV